MFVFMNNMGPQNKFIYHLLKLQIRNASSMYYGSKKISKTLIVMDQIVGLIRESIPLFS